jgi:HTH-type transcriptional regulator / antitoxin HipB
VDFPVRTGDQLGAILRGFRRAQGLTQEQLASRLGLAQKAISYAERSPESMGVMRLFQLLAALNVELVLRDSQSKKPPPTDW